LLHRLNIAWTPGGSHRPYGSHRPGGDRPYGGDRKGEWRMKWICTVCDYVHEGDAPPDECPLCGVGPDQFEEVK
jgi:rubrerythrin